MTHIEQRIDTAANWALANTVLNEGERGFEKDTRKSKTGDGVTAWNDLDYEVSAISATKADIGLSAVDNTSDMDKPISTAQQAALDTKADVTALDTKADVTALDAKADLDSPAFTGTPTAPTPAGDDSSTSVATTASVQLAMRYRSQVRCATTANITLSGLQTIDGVSLNANERVLVKNQTSKANNGVYVVSSGAWSRFSMFDTADEISAAVISVLEGTTNGGTKWMTSFKRTNSLGTDDMNWLSLRPSQSGVASVSLAASQSGTLAVTFDTPFPTTPRVVASAQNADLVGSASGASPTGFTAQLYRPAGATTYTGLVTWIASL